MIPEHPSSRARMGWQAAWAVLTAFVAVAVWKLWPTLPVLGRTLGDARVGWVMAAIGLNFVGQPLQAMAWTRFVPSGARYRPRAFVQTAGTMAAVANSVPLFMSGLATGVQMLATRGGLGHPGALAVVSLDQLSEGVAKLVLVAVVLATAPLPPALAAGAWALAVGVAFLAAVLWVAAGRRRDPGARAAPPDAARGWLAGAVAFVGQWADSLESLRSPGRMVAGVALVLAIKAGEGGAIWAVAQSLHLDVPFWSVPLVLLAVNLSTMIGVTPANLGVYEGAAFAAWTLAGVDAPTALALALLQHAAYLAAALGGGWLLATAASGARRPA